MSINKKINQFKKFAIERLGTNQPIGELPQEYLDLEKKIHVYYKLHNQLLRYLSTFNQSNYDLSQPFFNPQPEKTLYHGIATAALSKEIDTNFGNSLFKYAKTIEKVGEARVRMDYSISSQVNQPMVMWLDEFDNLKRVMRQVRSSRYLDKETFDYNLNEAMSLMKSILLNPIPLGGLADLVHAQLLFVKEAHELMTLLVPELDKEI